MSSKLKLYLSNKVLNGLTNKSNLTSIQLNRLFNVEKRPPDGQYGNKVAINMLLNPSEEQYVTKNFDEVIKIEPDSVVTSVRCLKSKTSTKLSFAVNRNAFIKDVFENCATPDVNSAKKNIVVEYSSPNIAKPFHMGHLRSTIIGNFIYNLYKHLDHNVTSINYLGNWGTQFGLMKVGMDLLKQTPQYVEENSLKLLYAAYVYANKMSETDNSITERARQAFTQLESGESEDMDTWKKYMECSISELKKTYKRIGINFDVYNYESMYNARNTKPILETMKRKHLLAEDEEKRTYTLCNDQKVPLIKSDGSTLYLTRDIAAAVDRFKRYQFDQMFYVVDNSQKRHFDHLKSILKKLDYPWECHLQHVKFGRINGMSSRKGNAIFLNDILDDIRELMQQNQLKSPNTKVSISDGQTTDTLGISCIIINELKQRRQKDYNFSWERALQVQGDTGARLQYTHCRLFNLEEQNSAPHARDCIPELIPEDEVTSLAAELAQFNEVLYKAEEHLEASVLVVYLFRLCNIINRTLQVLQVKGAENDVAAQRLLVFNTAREVLRQGMTILGIQPLNKM